MTALKLAYFLAMLLGMLAAIWKYVIMDTALIAEASCRRLRAGLPLLAVFMGVNFLSEFVVDFILMPSTSNHFVYGTGACLTAALMLTFYGLLAPGRLMRIYAALSVSYLIYFWINHALWQPGSTVPQPAFVGYYGMMAIGSVIFGLSCRRGFGGIMRRWVLLLSSITIAYYMVSSVTIYLQVCDLAYDIDERRMLSVTHLSVALLFYAGILFMVMRIPDKASTVSALGEERVR